ncbi:hypothetical protein NHX12_030108 [Muraenolepis orangiensis]|uniref:Glycosyltransferase family 92 protein n=1 Tax=Muraenolepis orangiensis TaxID=630683 RepID=A0A9Q0ILE0_9TELE|nr:hypothetical protein NHX12_030108 [Muraenolepis orangiensis]
MCRTAFLTSCTLVVWTTSSVLTNGCHGPTVTGLHTELCGSKHIILSAYREHRQARAVRVLAIVNTDHPAAVDCVFCCSDGGGRLREGSVQTHTVHYGYPYVAADILCDQPPECNATQVPLSARCGVSYSGSACAASSTLPVLTIHNEERREDDFPFFLTVCMSTVSGNYSNILQVLQTMELYRLWGVQKVVLYLTSCSGDFQQVLEHYVQEGFLETIPWRLGKEIQEDIHHNGQLSVMNECIYRNMYTSRYVLLADVDQLLVPYKHRSLQTLVEELQAQHPQASVFRVETHLFPQTGTTPQAIPGQDLLKQVYREPMEEHDFRSHKMVVNPRLVVQTAMFEVLKNYGETVDVPSSMCKILQVKLRQEKKDTNGKNVVLDTRIEEFKDLLNPKVNEIVKKTMRKQEKVLD